MSSLVVTGFRRNIGKRVPADESTGGRGFTTVPDGHEIFDVRVDVDLERLARLYAHKAATNKSAVAKQCNGLVKISVVKRQRVPA